MPYIQQWIDPNTGATYSQSYVRVNGQPQVDFGSSRVSFNAARYASQTCFSLGFHPLEARDVQVAGVPYASWFAVQVAAAQASFFSGILSSADAYLGSVPTLSGAAPSP